MSQAGRAWVPAGPDAAASGLRAWLGEAVWFVKGVLGANAYDHYLAHHFGTGCDHPPMTERQFWRAKMDDADRSPTMRCC